MARGTGRIGGVLVPGLIDAGAAHRYVTALELHILPVLRDYCLDVLTSMAVHEWLNGGLRKLNPKTRKPYDGETVFGWS